MSFIRRYVEYASNLTEAPKMFHYYLAYLLIGQMIGRRGYCDYAQTHDGANFWMVFIGPSSAARKSSALKIATDILNEIYLSDTTSFLLTNSGSYESWIEQLDKRKNEAGEAEALMFFDEFKLLRDWVSRDYNSPLEATLMQAYDGVPIKRNVGTRKNGTEYFIPHPCLSIMSASTLAWFNKSIDETRIMSGFLPRFNIIYSDAESADIPRRPIPDFTKRDELVQELKRIKQMTLGRFTYDDAAGKLYDKWYTDIKNQKIKRANDLLAPFYIRRRSDVHKYAMANCVMRGTSSLVMNKQDVEQAIEESIKNVMYFTDMVINEKMYLNAFQENRIKVLRFIEQMGGLNGGAQHHRILKASKLDKWNFDKIIETLCDEDSVTMDRQKDGRHVSTLYKIKTAPQEDHDVNSNVARTAGQI